MIAKLLAERQQLEGLSTYPTLKDSPELTAVSPDLIHKRKHEMRLTFICDQGELTPTITDSSPQSTTTLFTCISSASDYETSQGSSSESPSECTSSLNEHSSSYLQCASTDTDNGVKFKRSVSDTGRNGVLSSDDVCVAKENLDCEIFVDPVRLGRDIQPPTVFLFDMEELTCEPFKHEKTIMSQGNDFI